ncbi:Copine-9, partial [Bonamia ostreae]
KMLKTCLRIKCSNLPCMDLLSKSDPFVVVSEKTEGAANKYRQLGHTEPIKFHFFT